VKKIFTLIILLWNFPTLFGQESRREILVNTENNSLHQNRHRERLAFFDIASVEKMNDEFVLRIWTPNSFMEIRENQHILNGKISFNAFENTKKPSPKVFVKEFTLSATDSKGIFELFKLFELKKYKPNNSEIKTSMNFDLDNSHYEYEIKSNNSYKLINSYTNDLQKEAYAMIDYQKYLNEFENEIPFKLFRYWGTSYSVGKLNVDRKQKN
jgi:hypothetical protein